MKDKTRITLDDIKSNPDVDAYLETGTGHLRALGYTEHGTRHAGLVASIAHNILERLEYSKREQELAAVAGYLHDIGNVVSRFHHAQIGAAISERILSNMGMPPREIATVIGAIGSHDPEDSANAVSFVSAALILADKSDVHRSRVRNSDILSFDVHDRVNYAVTKSFLRVHENTGIISLELTVDTQISPVMEYFEIFLTRMLACKRSAEFLNSRFELNINDVRLL